MFPLQSIRNLREAIKKVSAWVPADNAFDENEYHEFGLSLPPELSGLQYADICAHRSFSNEPEQDWDNLNERTHQLYEIVMEVLGNNGFRISGYGFSDKEKSEIILALSAQGFKVKEDDFMDIIEVVRTVRDESPRDRSKPTRHDTQLRHASLNCYDYDRFKDEMRSLAEKVGFKKLEFTCPTLVRITREAAEGENNPYPGRHLPFDKLRGQSAWRYQCLRLMDEILHTSDDFISNEEMIRLIIEKSQEYGINKTKDISGSAIKKLYSILSDLINVEHTQERRERYSRSVYEPGGSRGSGHKYRIYKGNKRLSAFTVDISIPEAFRLRREIGKLRAECFDDSREYFAEKFPLLSLLGYMEELSQLSEDNPKLLNHLKTTDLITVNYKPFKFSELKQKVEKAVSLHMPIAVRKNDGWEMLLPISIKEDRDKWVLLAKSLDSNILRIITPDVLEHTFNTDSNNTSQEDTELFENNIIGISPLIKDKPYQVTLELTKAGINDIKNKESVLNQVIQDISHRNPADYEKYSKGSLASLTLYLNDDFLNELFRLDKTAKLISIEPTEVNDIYEEYFEMRMGRQRVPLHRRPASMRTLKEPKRKPTE